MAALAAPGEAPRGYPDILPKRRRPRSLRCRSAPFIDHPGQMQRPARHIRPRVRVLNFFSRFTMADFKNRLAAKTRTPSIAPPPRRHPQGCRGAQGAAGVLGLRGGTAEPQGPSALPAGGGGLPGRSSGPAAGGGRGGAPIGDATPRRPTARRCPRCPGCPRFLPLHRPPDPDAETRAPHTTEGPGFELFFAI